MRIRQGFLLVLAAAIICGCSAVPNMDHGSAGCSNTTGIGPRNEHVRAVTAGPPNIGVNLKGLPPATAAEIARSRGHTVVFNVQIPGYGECWCVPPPMGTVQDWFFGSKGQLYLQVDGVDVGHTPDDQPFLGWGC